MSFQAAEVVLCPRAAECRIPITGGAQGQVLRLQRCVQCPKELCQEEQDLQTACSHLLRAALAPWA